MPQPNSGNQPDSVVEPNQAHGNLHVMLISTPNRS